MSCFLDLKIMLTNPWLDHETAVASENSEGGDQSHSHDSLEWAVVNNGIREEPKTHGGGMSSQFTFEVGWGRWKWTVFSWDINVRRGHSHSRSRGGSSGD